MRPGDLVKARVRDAVKRIAVKPGDLVTMREWGKLYKDDPWKHPMQSSGNFIRDVAPGEVGIVISREPSATHCTFCLFSDQIGFIMTYHLENA